MSTWKLALSVGTTWVLFALESTHAQHKALPGDAWRNIERQLSVRLPAGSAFEQEFAKTQAVIRRLRDESLLVAMDRLTEDGQYPLRLLASSTSIGDRTYSPDLEIVLGSRRFARVLSLVKAAEAGRRKQATAQAFSDALQVCKRTVARILRAAKDPKAPRNRKSLLECKWGLIAAFFLTARFGDLDQLALQIMQVREFEQDVTRMSKEEGIRPSLGEDFFRYMLYLNPEVQLNVIVRGVIEQAQRTAGGHGDPRWCSEQDLLLMKAVLKHVAALPQKKLTIYPWDSAIVATDPLHMRDGIPVSASGEEIVMYTSFDEALVDNLLALMVRSRKVHKGGRTQ